MSILSELAESFCMNEKELCLRAGYTRMDMERILEADTVRYPGEFMEMMNRLTVMSIKMRDNEMRLAAENHLCRLGCLEEMAEEHGMDIRPSEDPHVF